MIFEDEGFVTITLIKEGETDVDVGVALVTFNGTAKGTYGITSMTCNCLKLSQKSLPGGEDFIPRNLSSPPILFSPDVQSRNVSISILQDSAKEEREIFSISLVLISGPGKINTTDQVNVTILDSECTCFSQMLITTCKYAYACVTVSTCRNAR